jgi:hypothetical protein
MSSVGQVTGNERFTRQGRQPGQFVGGDSGDVRNFLSAATGGGFQNTGPGAGRRGNAETNTGQTQRVTSPHRLQIAFDTAVAAAGRPPAPAASRAQQSLTRQFNNRLPVAVTVVGRTAILRGVVATDQQRDLAARVALLEAGISAVQNEIAVAERLAPPVSAGDEELAAPAAP